MKHVFQIGIAVIFLFVFTKRSLAQTRDDVNRSSSKPKDTTVPSRPKYINVDTTKPVPIETKTLVRSVLRIKKIYTTPDALAICRILNPEIYKYDSTLSNHTIILPYLPDPPSELRRSVKENFKKELKPDPELNNRYSAAAMKFDTLANIFSATEFPLPEADTGNFFPRIVKFLPALANLAKQAATLTMRTSQKTVGTLTSEVEALNSLLEETTSANKLSAGDLKIIYSLMSDINLLVFMINDRKMKIDSLVAENKNLRQGIYLAASYSVPVEFGPMESEDDPQKFNIYVFRKSILETIGDRNPELDLYTVSYVIPALESYPDLWTTIPKMASTTSASFAPARFKFSIKDNRTGKSYYASADLFDAEKDPNEKWTLMDLFDPHPVYRLMFLIP